MSFFPNADSIYIFKRKGTSEDPFVDINEQLTVANNRVVLKEVPDSFTKVAIDNGGTNTWNEVTGDITTESDYKVDYSLGIVHFHANREGLAINVAYKGTGLVSLPASRVWTETDGNSPTKTLQDEVEIVKQATTDANTATTNANTATTNANNSATYATEQGDYALQSGDSTKINWKGTLATKADLPASPVLGDTHQVESDGTASNNGTWRWDGVAWIKINSPQAYDTRLVGVETNLSQQDSQTSTLQHGTSVIQSDQASPLKVEFYGKSLTNILGKYGNCESLTPFTSAGGTGTYALSTTQVKDGANSIKFTTSSNTAVVYKNYDYSLDTSKYYIVIAWVYLESYTSGSAGVYIRDYGVGTVRYSQTIDTSKVGQWQLVYIKIPSGNTLVGNGFTLYFGNAGSGTMVAHFDSIRLNETTSAQHDKIGVSLLDADVQRMFPYVDSVQHVKHPVMMVEGSNLIPPFNEATSIHANASVTKPYELTLNATAANQWTYFDIKVMGGKDYTLSTVGNSTDVKIGIDQYVNGTLQGSTKLATGTNPSISLTTISTTDTLRVYFASNVAGTFVINEPLLNLGLTKKPFVPRNPAYLFAETTLAGNDNKKDILSKNESLNRWEKIKHWETDVVLDGSLGWSYSYDYTGYKRVQASISGGADESQISIKYDGKILKNTTVPASSWETDSVRLLSGTFYITISDSDSGWLEYYKPLADDQKGYFYGWKANGYTAGTNVVDEATGLLASGGTYNLLNAGNYRNIVVEKSADNATWSSAVEGTDYTLSWNGSTMTVKNATAGSLYFRVDYNHTFSANSWASLVDGSAPSTNTLAYVSANMAPGFTPYELTYQLAKSTVEPVTVEGDLSISGDAQVSTGEGVIVREVATPVLYSAESRYYINQASVSGSELDNKANKIIAVYKNGEIDKNWIINVHTSAYGKERAYIDQSLFDTTATYTVTYEILDKYNFTTNIQEVIANWNSSLKSSFQQVVEKVSDHGTQLSIHDRLKANKAQEQWINATLQNGWVNYGTYNESVAYMKDDFGFVNISGVMKSGTTTQGTVIFTLPKGYRPKTTLMRYCYSTDNSTSHVVSQILIKTSGEVEISFSNVINTKAILEFSFRAEQ